MSLPFTYVLYLLLSTTVTVTVARTLHRRGRVFLIRTFHGNTELADAVNSLLVVGFYLVNLGYVTLALKYGARPSGLLESIEYLSTKVGLVLLILGTMHCGNLVAFSWISRRGRLFQGQSCS